jgi:hypothetical protein
MPILYPVRLRRDLEAMATLMQPPRSARVPIDISLICLVFALITHLKHIHIL